MKLNPVRLNMTVLELNDGREILFSYETPVAAKIDGKCYRTDTSWSKTTSRHINQWLLGRSAENRPQEFFNNLIK